MAVKEEDFYYHRISQDIVEDMIFAMEGWIPFVDLVQVFDNELGLCITKDYMVTPIVYRTGEDIRYNDGASTFAFVKRPDSNARSPTSGD